VYLNVICSDDEGIGTGENPSNSGVSARGGSKENATNTDNIDTEPGIDYGFMLNHYNDQS
jgi:hypothetical protein